MKNKLKDSIWDAMDESFDHCKGAEFHAATEKIYDLVSELSLMFAEYMENRAWELDYRLGVTHPKEEQFEYFINNIYKAT